LLEKISTKRTVNLKDVVIAGGGLAGLICAIQLAEAGLEVEVVEKKAYPFHKVCGEYISNEVVPFLESINCYPSHLKPAGISRFRLSDTRGREVSLPLDLGGFGISRYRFDHFLYEKALEQGATFRERTWVQGVEQTARGFEVQLNKSEAISARLLVGSWGKRSTADKALDRNFIDKRTDYIGVKYHIKANLPHNEVALHNFPGGYCGIVKIEGDRWNMCYLGSKEQLRQWGSLEEMEKNTLGRNPVLARIMEEADYVRDKAEVINEINFQSKKVVERGVLMAGDAAGLITPLCGNGMAMAIHAGKLLSDTIIKHWPLTPQKQAALEADYKNAWQKLFARRLWVGRQTQRLFGGPAASAWAVKCLRSFGPLGGVLMRQTHGKAF
jgi:flavin-dependent dehydrogenase